MSYSLPQDRVDDKKLGLKSTALTLGDQPQPTLTAVGAGSVVALSAAGWAAELGAPYFVGMGIFSGQLLWQVWSVDLNDRAALWARFDSNKVIGGLVFTAIVVGKVWP